MRTTPVLTHEAFTRLKALLGSDDDLAGQAYEHLRRLLIDFFRWRKCTDPQALADDVIDRIARQLQRGETINSPRAYCSEVARKVHLEHTRSPERRLLPLGTPAPTDPELDPYARVEAAEARRDLERRIASLHGCLNLLPPETRVLFLRYHHASGRSRMQQRKRLAEELGISINALRIRVCRVAENLAVRIEERMRRSADE